MSKMREFILFMFYLSVAGCLFLLSKWVGLNKKPDHPWKRVDVLITLLLAAPVWIFVQVSSPKEAIAKFFTKVQAMGNLFVLTGLIFVSGTLAHRFMMNDPEKMEAWIVCCFFLALLLFVVLHATKEVSGHVCQFLAYQLFSFVLIDLIRCDSLSAIASGVTCFVCFLVLCTGFGGAEVTV